MKSTRLQYILNAVFIFIIGLVLCGAFGYQFIKHEDPCPLCLLQRLAMLGITVGCMLNLRFGINMAHYGLVLFSSLFGATVSLRQIGLHVCPQFPTFGEPVFGFDLYAWALFVFAASVLGVALLLYLYGTNKDPKQKIPQHGILNVIAYCFMVLIAFAEILTTFSICGFSACQG